MMYRILLALVSMASAASAQVATPDPVEEAPAPTPVPHPLDDMALAKAAAGRGDAAEALSRYLRVLATRPDDVAALSGAGQAALTVGDLNAASGFFGRAEGRAPNDGAVKAGIGSTLVRQGDARGALRYFKAAAGLGVPEGAIAADRGLAYDLRGETKRAQAEYALALRASPGDAGLLRRLALSQAIGGEQAAAQATLDPLLRKQDVPAWRTRIFARALAGDVAGANADAALVLNAQQAAALAPYLARLATLKAADKAAAVFLGRFPSARPAVAASGAATPNPRIASAAPQPAAGAAFENVPLPPASAVSPPSTAASAPPAAQPLVDLGAPAATMVPDSPALRAIQQRVTAARAEIPARPTMADRRRERAEAAAEKAKAKKAEASEKAAAQKLAAKKAAAADPTRYWVQVAGGANVRDLPKAWAALKAKYPAALGGRSPSTMHYRSTNRLLIGPFASSAEAQAWVNEKRKTGIAAFPVTTPGGTKVEPVG